MQQRTAPLGDRHAAPFVDQELEPRRLIGERRGDIGRAPAMGFVTNEYGSPLDCGKEQAEILVGLRDARQGIRRAQCRRLLLIVYAAAIQRGGDRGPPGVSASEARPRSRARQG